MEQNNTKNILSPLRVVVFGLVVMALCIYLAVWVSSMAFKFDRVSYGSDLAEVTKILGRPPDSSWLPAQYVCIWHEQSFNFSSKPPYWFKTLSKMYVFTFSPKGELVKKEVYDWVI